MAYLLLDRDHCYNVNQALVYPCTPIDSGYLSHSLIVPEPLSAQYSGKYIHTYLSSGDAYLSVQCLNKHVRLNEITWITAIYPMDGSHL